MPGFKHRSMGKRGQHIMSSTDNAHVEKLRVDIEAGLDSLCKDKDFEKIWLWFKTVEETKQSMVCIELDSKSAN